MTHSGTIENLLTGLGISENSAPIWALVGSSLVYLGFLLFMVLALIYGLRKIMGFIQHRIGPVRTGPQGLLQTPMDALKLLQKEDVIPAAADRWVFILAPIVGFVPAYLAYVCIPLARDIIPRDLSIGILFIIAISSMHIIGILMAGWASNNKYALLGAFRGAAQLISYEVPMVLAMLGPILLAGTLSMQGIVTSQNFWYVLVQPIGFLVFFAASLCEINMIPFDFSEAESELVSGFNIEYSGMKFAFFFLAEFMSSFTLGALVTVLYLGGWQLPWFLSGFEFSAVWANLLTFTVFMIKALTVVFVLMWIRSTLPRIRIDQLLGFGWKVLTPISLVNLAYTGALVVWVLPAR